MPKVVERAVGREELIIETGKLAGQAHGAATVRYGETIILATAVMSEKPRSADMDFLPLTVDYEERLYSAGKIPGSFFRREGRPGQEAILTSRLVDRSIRPLFPKGLHNDVQMTITTLSADGENPPEILAMVGASAALNLSQIPFAGPIGATRIAYRNGEYVVNPTYLEMEDSQLSMVVSSTADAILMVEAGSDEVSEEVILEGIRLAHQANLEIIGLINELSEGLAKPKVEAPHDEEEAKKLDSRIKAILNGRLNDLLEENPEKMEMEERENRLSDEVAEQLAEDFSPGKIAEGFKSALREAVRGRILDRGIRPDGRGATEIRPISCEVGCCPGSTGQACSLAAIPK